MDIHFRKDSPERFLTEWKRYVSTELASFRQLPTYLDYSLIYARNLLSDQSFVVTRDGQCVGVCLLPVESSTGQTTISMSGDFTVAPLASDEKVQRLIFDRIDEIAREQRIEKISFFVDPLVACYGARHNELLRYGYLDATTGDVILSLRATPEELWSGVRKGHKSDIQKLRRDPIFEIELMDQANARYELHEQYRALHRKCAGRETRPKETFDKQFQMVQEGNALLVALKREGVPVCFNYFMHHQKTAIYMSGADDPDWAGLPLYHLILWTAIEHYHRLGYEFLQFSWPAGYQKVSGFQDYLDDKQISISRFKRGFGGDTVSAYRGVKYFSESAFRRDLAQFEARVLESLREGAQSPELR